MESGKLWMDDKSIWTEVNQFVSEWMSPAETIELQTSGSTGKPKEIVVQKEWMSNSTQLTGKTFGLKIGDTALLCLPMKYIAGKMMVVRALELGLELKVVEPSSSPLKEIDEPIDFAAMVPLQLEKSINELHKVKTLLIGGGKVHHSVLEKCQSVSTEIYETYGMTESLTHVAIKRLNGPNKSDVFTALEGISFEKDKRGCLVIHAPFLNPQPVVTNDLVDLVDEKSFCWLGRIDHIINTGGVKIIPELVEEKLAAILSGRRYFITGLPDESLGEKVVLVIEGEKMKISFNRLDSYEKPKQIIYCQNFKMTQSGKIRRKETLKLWL
jgi:O-succinylbenzoic acid--CoA ligase